MQYETSSKTEITSAIKTAECLPEVECKNCGNCTTMKGINDTTIIIAA